LIECKKSSTTFEYHLILYEDCKKSVSSSTEYIFLDTSMRVIPFFMNYLCFSNIVEEPVEEGFSSCTDLFCNRFTFKQVNPFVVNIHSIVLNRILLEYKLKGSSCILVTSMNTFRKFIRNICVLLFKICC
jgi:hypothetical protein